MKTIPLSSFIATLAILLSTGQSTLASDPIGIYAFVDKIVFEPSEENPERIQIWGGFALAEGRGYTYAAAKRGYLYFRLKPGKEELCRNEWKDLQAVAGTRQIVAFGSRYEPKGTVRSPETEPKNPDVHPIGFGLTRVPVRDYPPINELLALQKRGARGGKKESQGTSETPRREPVAAGTFPTQRVAVKRQSR